MSAVHASTILFRFKHFFIFILFILLLSFFSFLLPTNLEVFKGQTTEQFIIGSLDNLPKVVLQSNSVVTTGRNNKCNYYNCFNVYRCGFGGSGHIHVYVYPLKKYVDAQGNDIGIPLSKEYFALLKAIVGSKYYTPHSEKACVFIPSIDTLNQNKINLKQTSQALAKLPFWNGGENHLLFNMIPGVMPDYNTVTDLAIGNAMLAGAGFDSWTYRVGYDLSIPVFSPLAATIKLHSSSHQRPWLMISSQLNIHPDFTNELLNLASVHSNLYIMESCADPTRVNIRCHQNIPYNYPNVLKKAVFCLILRGARLGQTTLHDALAAGCIPIIVADTYVMPFSEVIDWKRAAIFVQEGNLNSVYDVMQKVSEERRVEMSQQVRWLYKRYFVSIEVMALTALDIINERVFPENMLFYEDWNIPSLIPGSRSPLFLPVTASRSMGFTAVILMYDRISSLFTLIQKLATVPSLSKILVIWNHQHKPPPPESAWPKIMKPLKVIQTPENKLSNRFYPYDEIETEAILSIDDDIVMMTNDELEFGFEVWREFPDRLVGFPSRLHVWDNVTGHWKYESEWTNNISMVLTGVSFYHKYWNYMYTKVLPKSVRDWVDDHMNCEDIAMNFLVANVTNKAPIKVTPRKKFKCPQCTSTEMLSADLSHMIERSHCIDRFTTEFGRMPLLSIEFRADPVLYKDNIPEKLKRFSNIGSL